MSQRLDVRRMLLRRGWTEDHEGILRKGHALWAPTNNSGDSGLDGRGARGGRGPRYTVEFSGDVPARVIAATCEAAT